MIFPRQIYSIRHNVTGRVYVGSSSNVDKRIKYHLYLLRNHNHPVEDMQSDFDKYGEDYSVDLHGIVEGWGDREKEYDCMRAFKSYIREYGYNYKDWKFHHKEKRKE